MLRFLVTALAMYMAWMAFTFSLNVQNLIIGLFASLCVALVSSRFLFHSRPTKTLNPVRWSYFIGFLFVLFYTEISSHMDVAYRVVTGRIKPGIVKVKMPPETDIGKTLLGSAITVTPGTLLVGAEKDLYMHAIHYKKGSESSELLSKITRKVTE